MNKKISTPIAIIIVIILAFLVGGIVVWQYFEILKNAFRAVDSNFNVATYTSICGMCLDKDRFPEENVPDSYNSLNWSQYETSTPQKIYLKVLMPGKITAIIYGSMAGGPNNIFLSQTPATWIRKIMIEELPDDINPENLLDYLNEDYGYKYSFLDKFSLKTIALSEDATVLIVLRKGDWGTDIPCYALDAAILIPSQELIRILGPGEQTNMINGDDTQLKITSFLERNQSTFKEIIQQIQIGFSSE